MSAHEESQPTERGWVECQLPAGRDGSTSETPGDAIHSRRSRTTEDESVETDPSGVTPGKNQEDREDCEGWVHARRT
jgi:hypothetical protein